MKNRLTTIMADEHITASKMAAMLEVQPSAISHILSGRNKPSYDFIIKLITVFPQYSSEWLLLGTGDKFKSEKTLNTDIQLDLHEESTSSNIIESQISAESQSKEETFKSNDVVVSGRINEQEPEVNTPAVNESKGSDSKEKQTFSVSSNEGGITKVLVFHADHTFEEFSPR